MRGYFTPMLIGAAIGSIMTLIYTRNEEFSKSNSIPKKAVNFLQNMGEDLIRR